MFIDHRQKVNGCLLQKDKYRNSYLIYNHVSEEYSEPQPAVRLPCGTDLLEL